jgi:YgiT-type zinc finger domain-containing protein
MKCIICKHGETHPGFTTVILQRGEHTVVIKDVPSDICENCGEYYLSEEVASRLYLQAEQALKRGAEVEIGRYALTNA